MAKIAINGLGRMGKLALRVLAERDDDLTIALANDIAGDAALHAHLLEFDSVHGHWDHAIGHGEGSLDIDGHPIRLTAEARIEDLPLRECGIDIVLECTGKRRTFEALAPYFAQGVRKVIVAAPVKDDRALNIVYGVNHHLYDAARHDVVTAASCTTNCLAPVVKVVHENIGIKHGAMTTIHDVTNTQEIVDRPHKDLRRARSALNALIPTTTGSATAISLIYPELAGRLNGHAVRVPILNASLTDCVFEVEKETDVDAVNELFRAAAETAPLAGILGFETRPLVSADYVNDPRSSIVDGLSTMVVNGTQVKIFAWYDNEWGYVHRMADVARLVSESL